MNMMRSALRGLAGSPRLSLAGAVCVGLGAAATAAVATLISATLVRGLPFPEADRLQRIWLDEEGGDPRTSLTVPELRELSRISAFDTVLGTVRMRVVALLDGGVRMRAEAVTRGYFETLGLRAEQGRLLEEADHRPGSAHVTVLSHATWIGHFGGASDVVGRTLRTDRSAYTIVGVAPAWFQGTVENDAVELWVPLDQYEPAYVLTSRTSRAAWALGRLAPGRSASDAAAETAALGRALAERDPAAYARLRLRVEPMGENWRGPLRQGGLLLLGAAVLLLVVASINVAGLLLARVLDRRRELAVRAALGASPHRLLGQLLLEAVLLVLAGGALGVAAAPALLRGFLALSPVELPSYVRLSVDLPALAAAWAALAVVGVVAGCAPAVLGSRVAPLEVLADGGRGSVGGRRERRWGGVLVAGEVALTLVLLVAGGLLLRSWDRLERTPLGYPTRGLARLAVTISAQDAPDLASVRAMRDRLRAELATVPGADSVGLVTPTLPPWDGARAAVRFPGLEPRLERGGFPVGLHLADAGLLPTLGIPLVAGRNLAADDGPGARVAVVSRSLAARLASTPADAVGRALTLVPAEDDALPAAAYRVVGVAENVAYDGLGEQDTMRLIRYGDPSDPRAQGADLYLPLALSEHRVVSIGVRTRGDAAALVETLRRRVARAAPNSAVHWTGTLAETVAGEYAPARFYAVLLAAFSASALLLTGIGLFAVVSHGVVRRAGEIGVRVALGASPARIVRLVLSTGLGPLLAGLALGACAAAALSRALAGVLYGVAPLDVAAFAGAAAALAATALPAAWLPARRAARLDPLRALRGE